MTQKNLMRIQKIATHVQTMILRTISNTSTNNILLFDFLKILES